MEPEGLAADDYAYPYDAYGYDDAVVELCRCEPDCVCDVRVGDTVRRELSESLGAYGRAGSSVSGDLSEVYGDKTCVMPAAIFYEMHLRNLWEDRRLLRN